MPSSTVAAILPVRRPRYRTQRIRSRRVERARNPWWVLIGSCTGLFVLMLDSTVVTLALPAIRSDLDASLDGLQWIQNAYLLTLDRRPWSPPGGSATSAGAGGSS